MPDFQVVVSDGGKSYKITVSGHESEMLIGRRIGDVIDGGILGLTGYKLQITGGTDKDGFPMRRDIPGRGRKRVLLSGPPGFNPKERGQRRRKTVRGNEISEDIAQINMKVVERGPKPIDLLRNESSGE
ncbi:30S ribosomal protein S6e [Methanosarcinales archaeon]|nr:MAG: 30S ribosomal protein S6e [Methanosarcinales archaeon]